MLPTRTLAKASLVSSLFPVSDNDAQVLLSLLRDVVGSVLNYLSSNWPARGAWAVRRVWPIWNYGLRLRQILLGKKKICRSCHACSQPTARVPWHWSFFVRIIVKASPAAILCPYSLRGSQWSFSKWTWLICHAPLRLMTQVFCPRFSSRIWMEPPGFLKRLWGAKILWKPLF